MGMRQVQILEATKTATNSVGRRSMGMPVQRIRVAAYCRVSTDGDEQLGSFVSQKSYYEEKIRQNKEWVLAGDRKSTRLNSSHRSLSRMPSSA